MRSRYLLLCLAASASLAPAQSPAPFTPTANLITPRAAHTATLLPNGKVLIAGGGSNGYPPSYLASAELYDPATGAFTATGNMVTPRADHTATLLPDGTVLIAGGFAVSLNAPSVRAELYDPSTGLFTSVVDVGPAAGQAAHTATLLGNGMVLIAGIGPSARLYDPASRTFGDTGPYVDPAPGVADTATELADGRVLITGCTARCDGNATQIYDPATNTFSATGPMKGWYNVNTATLLADGRVLIAGSDEYDEPADAEVYDPASGTFTQIGNASASHEFGTATFLPDGTVLIAGSQVVGGGGDSSAELYDPVKAKFLTAGNMNAPRHSHTATLLPDGSVLLAGGNTIWPAPTAAAEIYHPSLPAPSPVLSSVSDDGRGAILHGDTEQPVSPDNPAVAGEVVEIYGSGLIDGSVIPPQLAIGGRLAEILSFGAAPGRPGISQIDARVPDGIAAGPAVPVWLNYLGRPSNQVSIAVR